MEQSGRAGPKAGEDRRSLKLLIVEDNPADAELIMIGLSRAGYSLEWKCVDTEVDYLLALEDNLDLILSDWSLPQFSGMRALQLMKERKLDCPFIIVSGSIGEESAVTAMRMGAYDYLLKDRMDRLGQAIKNALERQHVQREYQKAAEALANSEAELRALFNSMRDLVIVLDRDGVYRKIAPTNTNNIIRRVDHLVGKSLFDIFPATTAQRLVQVIRQVLESQKNQTVEYQLMTPDTTIWYEAQVSPRSDQEVMWVARDISERKQAAAQIHLQAEALSAAANAITITDHQGIIEWANAAFCSLTGYTLEEIIGKTPGDLVRSGVHDQDFYQEMWDTILAGNVWRGVVINRNKLGQRITENLTITPIKDGMGRVIQFVAILEDISQKKLNEDILLARLRLHEFSGSHSLQELMIATVDEIEQLTLSEIGFCHFLAEDQQVIVLQAWSSRTIRENCTADKDRLHYSIDQAGVWVDCVLQRKAVIHNDYATLPHRKGYPEGHVPIVRQLTVPIFRNNKIVAILGVGNKASDYTEDDLQVVMRVADFAWDIAEIKMVNDQVKQHLMREEQIAALGRELANTREISQIGKVANRFLKQLIQPQTMYFAISLVFPQDGTLRLVYAALDDQDLPVSSENLVVVDRLTDDNPYVQVILKGSPFLKKDLEEIKECTFTHYYGQLGTMRAVCCLPMVSDSRVIGMIEVQSGAEDQFRTEDLEWLGVVANQVALSTQNAQLFSRVKQRVAELMALNTIDSAVADHLAPRQVMEVLMDQVITGLQVDAAAITSLHPGGSLFRPMYHKGFITRVVEEAWLDAAKVMGSIREGGYRALKGVDVHGSDEFYRHGPWVAESFKDYLAVPLVSNGQVVGVCELYHRSKIAADTEWHRMLENLVRQAGLVMEHLQIFHDLQQANENLLEAYDKTILGWSRAMDLRDKETENHTRRVTDLTLRLAEALQINSEQMVHLRRGALLHDIGKLGVPDSILLKTGVLSEEEWRIMRRHPILAYEMLLPIEYLHPALDIPYCHHEKWDGSGYPRGLRGEEIPLAARLFAVADVYDALTSDRPYRNAWPYDQVMAYFKDQAGKHFDPRVVEVFFDIMREQYQTPTQQPG